MPGEPRRAFERVQILVVDDDEGIRDAVREVLCEAGFSVVTRENGEVALEYLRAAAELPSLIVLDLMMPVLDGWAFLREASRDSRLCCVPIVVMSAGGAAARSSLGEKCSFLKKPIDVDALLAAASAYR